MCGEWAAVAPSSASRSSLLQLLVSSLLPPERGSHHSPYTPSFRSNIDSAYITEDIADKIVFAKGAWPPAPFTFYSSPAAPVASVTQPSATFSHATVAVSPRVYVCLCV